MSKITFRIRGILKPILPRKTQQGSHNFLCTEIKSRWLKGEADKDLSNERVSPLIRLLEVQALSYILQRETSDVLNEITQFGTEWRAECYLFAQSYVFLTH